MAWFVFAAPLTIHVTGFSQWLMTKFLSAEFIRRFGSFDWRVMLPHDRDFKRQCRNTTLQKKTIRHSLLAVRQSPIAIRCRFGSAVASPSRSVHRL